MADADLNINFNEGDDNQDQTAPTGSQGNTPNEVPIGDLNKELNDSVQKFTDAFNKNIGRMDGRHLNSAGKVIWDTGGGFAPDPRVAERKQKEKEEKEAKREAKEAEKQKKAEEKAQRDPYERMTKAVSRSIGRYIGQQTGRLLGGLPRAIGQAVGNVVGNQVGNIVKEAMTPGEEPPQPTGATETQTGDNPQPYGYKGDTEGPGASTGQVAKEAAGEAVGSAAGTAAGAAAATGGAGGGGGAAAVATGAAGFFSNPVVLLGAIVAGVGLMVALLSRMVRNQEDRLLKEIGSLNETVAQSIGAAEIQQTLAKISQANALSDELSRFAGVQSDFQVAWREATSEIVRMFHPMMEAIMRSITTIVEVITLILQLANLITTPVREMFKLMLSLEDYLYPLKVLVNLVKKIPGVSDSNDDENPITDIHRQFFKESDEFVKRRRKEMDK